MFKKKKEVMKKVTKHVRDNFVVYIGGVALITTTYFLWLGTNGLTEEVATLEVENEDLKNQLKNYVNKSERDINDAYRNGMSDGIKVVQTNLDCE